MANSEQQGRRLKARYQPFDVPFMLLSLVLVAIGLIMMYSASYARALKDTGNAQYYFIRQLVFAVIGIVAMFAASLYPYERMRRWSLPVYGGSAFLLVVVLLIGITSHGAQRWIQVGGITLQPSEIAKFAIILLFANMASRYREKMREARYGLWPFVAFLGVIAALTLAEHHLSATIILCLVGAVMMFLGGAKIKWFVLLAVGVAAVGFVYLLVAGYASDRVTAWLNPWADSTNTGYQIVQSLYAIGSGGLFGLGFGQGRQKYLYLPEEHNDYVFSIICEELGFVGAALIILLFILLILRGYWIAMHAKDRFGALLAAGITTLLALQVFLNIGVVSNLLPSTGISLPFFSYGGTALLMQLGEVGIVLSVSRECDNNLL